MGNIFVLLGALALAGALVVYFVTARRELAKLPPLKSKQASAQKKAQRRDKKQPKARRVETPGAPAASDNVSQSDAPPPEQS
jgi:hypothetical protein